MNMRHPTLGIVVSLALAFAACAPETVVEGPVQTYSTRILSKSGSQHALCGGIAGFTCPAGQHCIMHDDYPDAMGFCVGPSEFNRHRDRCALVRCFAVECPEGFQRIFTPHHCCGMCVPQGGPGHDADEGQCNVAQDCEGLPHIMCVGSWSCDQGSCSYSCDMSDPIAL